MKKKKYISDSWFVENVFNYLFKILLIKKKWISTYKLLIANFISPFASEIISFILFKCNLLIEFSLYFKSLITLRILLSEKEFNLKNYVS